MALNKLKFSSINVTPVANQAIKFNSSANGFETGSAGGAMTFIKKITASSDSTISFVHGSSSVVFDSTYKEYLFLFLKIFILHQTVLHLDFKYLLILDRHMVLLLLAQMLDIIIMNLVVIMHLALLQILI